MTRTKTLILGTTLALALGLAGCAHRPSNAQIGTGAGPWPAACWAMPFLAPPWAPSAERLPGP